MKYSYFNNDSLYFQKYAGMWKIGGEYGLCVYISKKPKWITRWLYNKLLEWEWIDITKG